MKLSTIAFLLVMMLGVVAVGTADDLSPSSTAFDILFPGFGDNTSSLSMSRSDSDHLCDNGRLNHFIALLAIPAIKPWPPILNYDKIQDSLSDPTKEVAWASSVGYHVVIDSGRPLVQSHNPNDKKLIRKMVKKETKRLVKALHEEVNEDKNPLYKAFTFVQSILCVHKSIQLDA
ncbi:hypothetical protein FCIRC_11911 [Fusarium circinatum]|uniref:Uncharacterized protein n=1 Tax=Fusarium circinatum TaxID=48490 RepID=A0A8H5T2P7_FUSCI|nr:hypothetical protein FCIRC_11911 [Fusarium circinatum]